MKKVLSVVLAFLMAFSLNFASAQKAPKKAKAETAVAHTKKDGTPDKRYKENKEDKAVKPVHAKKDGTPDKRYKENKDPKKS